MMRGSVFLVVTVAVSACAGRGGSTGQAIVVVGRAEPKGAAWSAVSVPHSGAGIGFDDIRYVPSLDRVLVAAGHTGTLALLRPTNAEIELVTGFTAQDAFRGGHDVGPTSADGGDGLIFVTDRTARSLSVIDATGKLIVSTVRLSAKPDLVRFVETTREVWVTEPDGERVEVFGVSTGARPVATSSGVIATPGGPEALTIDRGRARAYTHFGPTTVAIDLRSRNVTARWMSGCAEPSGIALDDAGGLLFVACSDGQLAVIDLSKERTLSRTAVTSSIDHIAFSPTARHLYVPDSKGARMTTFAVSRDGRLTLLGTIATVSGTECVTTDDRGHTYLCDPQHGRVLVVSDPYPANGSDR